jgi:hypothetical protein
VAVAAALLMVMLVVMPHTQLAILVLGAELGQIIITGVMGVLV